MPKLYLHRFGRNPCAGAARSTLSPLQRWATVLHAAIHEEHNFCLYYRNCSHGAWESALGTARASTRLLLVASMINVPSGIRSHWNGSCCNDNWYLASNGVTSLQTLKTSRWYWCLISNKSPKASNIPTCDRSLLHCQTRWLIYLVSPFRRNNRLGTSSLPLSHDWRKSNV